MKDKKYPCEKGGNFHLMARANQKDNELFDFKYLVACIGRKDHKIPHMKGNVSYQCSSCNGKQRDKTNNN